MVEAAKSATETKALLADKKASAPNKLLAGSIMALYSLVEALLEKALLPLAEHAKSPPPPRQRSPAHPRRTRRSPRAEGGAREGGQNVYLLWRQPR